MKSPILLILAFLSGLLYPCLPQARANSSLQLSRFMSALNKVQTYSLYSVDSGKLFEGGSRGLVASLGDPYSVFLNGEEYAAVQLQKSGEAVGIGVELAYRNQRVIVVSVLPDTPAQKAGIRSGDTLLAADQYVFKEMRWADINQRLQGEPGERLLLRWRSGKVTREAPIVREALKLEAWHLTQKENSLCHLQIHTFFNENIASEVGKRLQEESSNCYNGLVLDLRNNPGGLVGQAVDVAALLGVEGVVFQWVNRENGVQNVNASPPDFTWTAPLVVLVDQGSASASELLAAALKESGRAVVLGQTTFGKGLVQSLIPLQQGTGISLTTARYLTRQGHPVHKVGLEPDIFIQGGNEADTALKIALDYLF